MLKDKYFMSQLHKSNTCTMGGGEGGRLDGRATKNNPQYIFNVFNLQFKNKM